MSRPSRSASGSAPAAAARACREHGVAHFLEHMAFKGTARRSAQDIAEEIEAVGGELNAATGVDSTAYYARVLRQDLGARARYLERHHSYPALRPHRACARARRDPAGDRLGAGFARGHGVRPGAGHGLSRPACGAADPRHRRTASRRFKSRPSQDLSRHPLSGAEHGARRRRRRRSREAACRGRAPARRA